MKVDLDGNFNVATSPEETFSFLIDPKRFAPLLPYFKELKNVNHDEFDVVLEIGIPQIRGIVEVHVKLLEVVVPNRALYRSSGRHALGMVDSDMRFTVEPIAEGSKVTWSCVSIVNGTLASLAQGILVPLAKRQIKSLVKTVQDAFKPVEVDVAPAADGLMKRVMAYLHGLFLKKKGATS
jgi:carbon monoxide dehydrogenase subunit G